MARELGNGPKKNNDRLSRRITRLANQSKIAKPLKFTNPDPMQAIIEVPADLKKVKIRKATDPDDLSGNLLLVTSFNRKLYDKTGYLLLDSYRRFYGDDPSVSMLVCHEDMKFKSAGILSYDLNSSEFLETWTKHNLKNIPVDLGGTGTKENNPKLFKSKFNLQMSRWFRKIASLEYALKTYSKEYRGICWIDCDCTFQNYLPVSKFFGTLQNKHVGYHHGLRRALCKTGVETGLVIFKGPEGYEVLKDWIDLFETGSFTKYSRWDDGFVFKELIDREYRDSFKKNLLMDLGRTSTVSSVMNESVFKDYILHNKGVHYKHIVKDDLKKITGTHGLLD